MLKFKREILISLILCLFFIISSVSAASEDIDLVSAQNNTVEVMSADVNDNLGMNEADDKLAETDDGSFSALNTKISNAVAGDTVYLENDYKYDSSGYGQIVIYNAITIDGQGHTIDANGLSRIFVLNSANIILKNIIFKNGYAASYGGGAIRANSDDAVNVYNCTFINNTAIVNNGYGGAIASAANNRMGTISESVFIQNKCNWGSAIYNYALAGTIDKCIFVNNTGNSLIFGYGQTITNSILLNNNVQLFYGSGYTLGNNWFGNTIETMENDPAYGISISNKKYHVLNLVTDKTGTATVSLNNLYENGALTSDSNYALPSIKLNVSAVNVTVSSSVTLGSDGTATITYTPVDYYTITVKYNGIELTKVVKPNIFSSLKDEIINGGSEIILDQDYEFDSTKESPLGIDFTKDVTIDGQNHIIDAKGLSNIFNFDDTTSSYTLILKNIIFKNATGADGSVINFKGKKLEIINCSFLDNAASNTLINIESSDVSTITNSIFAGNTATYNVVGNNNVVANYNWWGNTLNNYDSNIAKVSGVTVNNWLYLDISAVTGITGTAIISLNNLYDGSSTSKYADYSLQTIRFGLGGVNATPRVTYIDIDQTGQAVYRFGMAKITANLTASYEDVTLNKNIEYEIVDDGSFRALNEIVWFSDENDVIELTRDYTYLTTDTLDDGVNIFHTLTINGNGHKIDAKGNINILNIYQNKSAKVTLKNITFTNGKSNYAGAVYWYTDVEGEIINCTFINNTDTYYGGGALALLNYVSIINSTFKNNSAGSGGVIRTNKNIDIENCSFINNKASRSGGAIYTSYGSINMKNCSFINNTASSYNGGAIYCGYSGTTLGTITNSTFINNSAGSGGAIYNDADNGQINRCVFINNSANNYGVIYSYTTSRISNSLFLNNSVLSGVLIGGSWSNNIRLYSNWFGNTIDNYTSRPIVAELIPLTDWYYLDINQSDDNAIISLILYNSTTQESAIDENYNLPNITFKLSQKNLILNQNEIKLNKTGQYKVEYSLNKFKGSITAEYENFKLTRNIGATDFEKLQKLIDDAEENEVIELTQNYTYDLEFDTLTEGFVISKKNLTIKGNGYTINALEKTRIFNVGSSASDLTLENISFVNAKVSGNGGAINWQASNGNLINCNFTNVTTNSYGGAIYFKSQNGKIINCTFINGSSDKGGFIYIDTGINSNVINSTFVNGYASTNAGGIYISATNCLVFNCTFDANHAGWGGAIETNKEKSTIANCTFKNNWATSDTRIINGYAKDLTIFNSTFIGNGKGSNNVLILVGYSNFKLINSTFVDNNAGIIQVSGSNAKVDKSLFINNTGNTICTISGTGGNVSNSIFLNNGGTLFSGSFTADYNWFGNRIDTNGVNTYKNTPSNLGITVNNWLYINATYDQEMQVDSSQTIQVLFKLYENGEISDYDASKVHDVNIKLKSSYGTLDKKSGVIGDTFDYTATSVGADKITVDVFNNFKVYDKYLNLNVLINKIPTSISFDDIYIEIPAYSNSVDLYSIAKISPEGVTGSFQLSTNDSDVLEIVSNYLISGLKAGTANLTVEFIPNNNNYESSSTNITFKITKSTGTIIVDEDEISMNYGGEDIQLEVSLTPDILQRYLENNFISLVYSSNDANVVTVTQNGVITPVNAGVANITIKFEETESWESFEKNVTVTVNKIDSSLSFNNDIEFDYGSSNTTTLTLTGCQDNQVTIEVIDHPEAVIEYNNETGIITLSGLDYGEYTLNVTTVPDNNHNSVWGTASIKVNKIDSSANVDKESIEFNWGNSNSTTLTLVGCDVDEIYVVDKNNNRVENAFTYVDDVITLSGLAAGDYTLKINLTINSNYNPTSNLSIPVKVNKIASSAVFSNTVEFDYLGYDTTELTLTGCSVDIVNITIVGGEGIFSFNNNIITVSGLAAGDYTLKVTTTPDGNHTSVDVTTTIKVNKIQSEITLSNTALVFDYGSSNTTAVTLNGCSVDLKNITILDSVNNQVSGTISIENNIITVKDLNVGIYTLNVTTTPDENHTSVYATATITVNKVNSSVTFSNEINKFFSESGSTTLTIDGCTVDLDNITVIDHPEAKITLENNIITVSNLSEGNYTLKVITTPDSNHLSVSKTIKVNVYKVGPRMELDYANITVGETEKVFIAFNTNATGTVNITISKGSSIIRTENITIATGFNKTSFEGLKVGTYNISAYYYGHGRYNASTLKYELNVHPIYEFEFTASANNTVVGNKTNVTVILPEGATGTIRIGDIEHAVDGTRTVVELPEQNTFGRNNITVEYIPDEDSKYSNRELTVLYDVAKVDTEIILSIINGTTDEEVTVTATIAAEGNVTFIINGKRYSREISDNRAVLELGQIAGGNYNVTAEYGGTYKYANSTANDTFTVWKLNSTISISLSKDSIKADSEATVTVTVEGTGTVTFTVNGADTNVTVNDKTAALTLKNLNIGTTTVSAKYLGDDKYNENTTGEITLTVQGADCEITLDIANITVGENAIAYITVPKDAESNITITISNGTVLHSENITGFKYVIPLDLAVGKYNITAKYTGDSKYVSNEITKEFTVNPLNVDKLDFNVTVNYTFVGETTNVTVKLPGDATGYIEINGIKYNMGDEITLPKQTTAGLNNITVKYIADSNSKYSDDEVTAYYIVYKKSAEITITPITGVKAGDDVTIEYTTDSDATVVVFVDGVETKQITDITAGKHTVIATVAENDKYLSATANYTFEVTKSDSLIKEITVDSVTEGQKTIINITMNSTESGNVIIEINGVNYTAPIKNDNASFEIALNQTTDIKIYYLGDDKFEAAESKTVTAVLNPKSDSIIVIDEPEFNIGQSATITATVNGNPVQIYINGVEQSTISNVQAITYNVEARFTGNATHKANSTSKTFTVNKLDVLINVSATPTKVGEKTTVTVNITEDATGIVVINVNGTEYSINISETKTLDVSMPNKGTVTVTVYYLGDNKYLENTNETTVEVTEKSKPVIELDVPEDIHVGDTVEMPVADGVDIYIDGVKQTPKDGKVTLPTTIGSHSIVAMLNETPESESAINVTSYEVTKKESQITISVSDIVIGKDMTIVVETGVRSDVSVSIDGNKVILDDSAFQFHATAGNHTVVAVLDETDEYLSAYANYTFNVDKKESTVKLTISSSSVYVGETVSVGVEIIDATGIVIIDVNGTQYSINLSKTHFVDVSLPNVGVYTITATYLGDEIFKSSSNDTTVEAVNKSASNIVVVIPDSPKAGETIEINITCLEGSKVLLDGSEVVLNNGKVIIPDISYGNHVLEVITPETATNNANSTTQTFTVSKKQSSINIKGIQGDLIVDSYNRLNIEYSGNTIIVYIDGVKMDNYRQFKADAGNHTVTASVVEDDEYLSSTDNYTFTISRKTPSLYVSGSYGIVGEEIPITVRITSQSTGIVLINVNGTEHLLNISQSTTLNLTFTTPGNYIVSARYLGDDKYDPAESESTYFIIEDKKDSTFEIEIPADINPGDTVTINVTSSNDEFEVIFDGVKQTITDGKITIENIAAGTHKIEVRSNETSEFKANSTSDEFTVNKNSASVAITLPDDIKLGDEVEISINSYDGADINVYIDGVKQNITDGKVTFKTTLGSHTITANVAETDKYLSASDNVTFSVDKLESEITVSGLDIIEGKSTTITVNTTLNEGIVSIKVNDTEVLIDLSKTKSTEVKLDTPGTYNIVADYKGTDSYKTTSAETTIKVSEKQTPEITVSNSGNANLTTLTVTLPENATGTVTVTVDGKNTIVKQLSNGITSIELNDLTSGSHNVSVTYDGDDYYNSNSKNTTVNVDKVPTVMDVEVSNPQNTTKANVEVTLPSDATGNVTITVDNNKSATVSVLNGKATVEFDDLTAGNHNITVTYSGDSKYEDTSKNNSVEISKITITDMDVEKTAEDSTVTLNVTLPDDATGNVTVTVDGDKTYTAEVTNGKANIKITDLESGTHNLTVTYSGDDKYNNKTVTENVTVKAKIKDFDINTAVENNTEGSTKIVVETPSDVTGTVTVKIGDKTYTGTINNGKAVIDAGDLAAGNYTAEVTYSGDDTYTNKTATADITVKSKLKTIIASNLKRGVGSPYDYQAKFLNKNGKALANKNIKFIIKGKTYTVKTDKNGVAKLTKSKLAKGTYAVTIINPVTGEKTTKNLTIVKRLLKNKNVVKDYGTSLAYSVLAIGNNGKAVGAGVTVSIKVNGKTYKIKTNKNGYAVRTIGLIPGKYTITAKYHGCTVSDKVVVKQVIKTSSVKVKKSAKSFKLKATLKTSDGKAIKSKKVTFTFKGKTYTAKTNKNGVASVKISKNVIKTLKSGKKYTFKVKYILSSVKKQVIVK